jgi:hypothetical protein
MLACVTCIGRTMDGALPHRNASKSGSKEDMKMSFLKVVVTSSTGACVVSEHNRCSPSLMHQHEWNWVNQNIQPPFSNYLMIFVDCLLLFFLWVVSIYVLICLVLLVDGFPSLILIYRICLFVCFFQPLLVLGADWKVFSI